MTEDRPGARSASLNSNFGSHFKPLAASGTRSMDSFDKPFLIPAGTFGFSYPVSVAILTCDLRGRSSQMRVSMNSAKRDTFFTPFRPAVYRIFQPGGPAPTDAPTP